MRAITLRKEALAVFLIMNILLPISSQLGGSEIESRISYDQLELILNCYSGGESAYCSNSLFNTFLNVSTIKLQVSYDLESNLSSALFLPSQTMGNVSGVYYDNNASLNSYKPLATNFSFFNFLVFYPEISTVEGWRSVLDRRNNSVIDGWDVSIQDAAYASKYPTYLEFRLREDGSVIKQEVSMVSHSPIYIDFSGAISNSSTGSGKLVLSVLNTVTENRKWRAGSETGTPEYESTPLATFDIIIALFLLVPIVIILVVSKLIPKRIQNDPFDDKIQSLQTENTDPK